MMRQLAEKHFQRGKRFELQAQLPEAEAAYRQACELSPDFAGPYFALARIEAGRGQHEAALGLLEQGIAIDRDLEMVEWRAYVRGRLRRYEEALDDYREVAAVAENPQVLVNLGRMLLALGRYDEAEETLERSGEPAAGPLIAALPRYREFGTGSDRVDDARAIRYLFARTVVLGTLGDGGIPLLANTRYLLLTPRHVALTIGRAMDLIDNQNWGFDGVVGGNAHHNPIAEVMSVLLALPILKEPDGKNVLVCSAVVNGVAEARSRIRPWRQKRGSAVHFTIGYVSGGDPHPHEPEMIGFIGKCAVPWYRVEAYSRLQPDDEGSESDSEWPGFKVGPAVVDPNVKRVKDGLMRASLDATGTDTDANAVLDYYSLRHKDVRAFAGWGD